MMSYVQNLLGHAAWADAIFFRAWAKANREDTELRERTSHAAGTHLLFLDTFLGSSDIAWDRILRGELPPPWASQPSRADLGLRAAQYTPRMSTVAHTTTAEALFAIPRDGWRYELVDGGLRRISPAGQEHGRIAMNFGSQLAQFVRERSLGVVFAAETGFLLRRNPDTVRAPDVAFVTAARVSTADGFFPGAPDLAVEVVSPSDSFVDVEEKVREWLGAGSLAVVIVNPRKRSVSVYRAKDDIRLLTVSDVLDLSSVVPGFRITVSELFE